MKKLIFAIILALLSLPLFSQNKDKSALPEMLGASNAGKEFWFSIPPCYEDGSSGTTNFIKLFVIAPTKTLVTVEVPASGYYKARNTIPNNVIEYNISPLKGQAYTKLETDENVRDSVFSGRGVHIYADDPFVVYCVVRFQYTSDGFLVIPVSSLGREYIISGNPVDPMYREIWNDKFPCITTITAPYADTKVSFTLGGTKFSKTKSGMKPGDTREWTLMKGDVLAIANDPDNGDLSGSKVVSSKPVGVVTGNMCASIPIGNQWCDYTAEMDIPTFAWGLNLHVGKMPYRKKASIIRIFAKEPNTKILRNGIPIGTIATAGGIDGKGYLVMRMTKDELPGSVVITGDKPISVTLNNTGVQEDGDPIPDSDPFVMSTTPVEQYQKEIMFCTPGIMGGQNFKENYINLVYETDSAGKMPDHFEFGGPINGGQFTWDKIKVKFPEADEPFIYNVAGKQFALKLITLPKDGVYKIRAGTPFAAYSFGYDWCDSYGFPTAAALADLEKSDTSAPVPTWTMKCDGDVADGLVTDMPEDIKVRANLSMIVFQSEFSFNYIFKYVDFIPGDTRTTNWTLAVTDKQLDARAFISFIDRKGNDTTIQIDYLAPKFAVRPESVNFGAYKTGEEKIIDFWIVNYSDLSDMKITKISKVANIPDFTLLLPKPLPWVIGKNDSVKYQVKFTAKTEGYFSDSIAIGNDCILLNKSYITARVGTPVISVTDVLFNTLSVGKSEIKEFHVTNEGIVDLVISGYTGPSNICYTTSLPVIDNSNPLIIKTFETKSFQITFSPKSVGKYTDKITFTSDAGTNRKNFCDIMGDATAPMLKSNNFDWGYRKIDSSYPAPGVITLANDGNEDLYVSDMSIIKDINGDAFEFNRKKITDGLSLPKSSFIYIPVVFHPTQIGEHELVLSFINTAGIDARTTLRGFGTLTSSVTDFFNSGINIITKNQQLLIELPENSSGDYSVSIFDLKGTQIYSKKDIPATFSNRIIIECGTFATGTYLLNLVCGNKYYIKKFVIQR